MSGTVDDLAGLPELEEKTLLAEIQARYKQEKIYTYIGDILIAVNPYKTVPIYGPQNWSQYTDVKIRSQHPPHLYVVSDSAYQNMKRNSVNQCCVVSGESGAGKTESTKLMIEHIVQLCQHDNSVLHQRIVQVNPLLEAFGNAQTVINDNSSRFGKFIELNFDLNGQILGASISEYLLEKSRVVTHGEGERSFHIFYYLFAGLDEESKEANLLIHAKDHRIMRQYPGEEVYEDAAEMTECKKKWEELLSIMTSVGFMELEMDGILAVLAAILHIADIKFIPDPSSDGVLIENENILSLISELLVVKTADLFKALVSNTSSAGTEKVTSLKNESQANDGRDALAKALYGRLFSWIVSKVNTLLRPRDKNAKPEFTIGILDIYGFENFKSNSFEQLCINVANEQLQYFFNLHIFKLELEEYEREGVSGSSVTFVDNRPLLDLFMDKLGLFDLLDDESKFPQGTDQSLIDKLAKNLDKKPELKMPKGQGLQFMIQHFAGSVTYSVAGFLEKNRDTLSDSIMRCLKTSTSLLVTEIFNLLPAVKGGGTFGRNLRMSVLMKGPMKLQAVCSAALKKGINPNGTLRGSPGMGDGMPPVTKTLTNHFKNSLDSLLQKLLVAQPHFIRCIKPNAKKEPNNFDPKLVLQQLSYTGVLETVKIRKQGYSSRLSFSDFVQRYGLIGSVISLKNSDNGANVSRQILEKSGLKDWQVGKTKVFLKYWHIEKLNLLLVEASKKVISCQKFWRAALAQLRLKQLRQLAKECAERWQLFCNTLAQVTGKLSTSLDQLHSQDQKDYVEHQEALRQAEEQRKKEQEMQEKQQKEKSNQSGYLKPGAHDTMNPSRAPQRTPLSPNSFQNKNENNGRLAPVFEDSLPEAFRSRPATLNSTTQILLTETLGKLSHLSTDIWAKVYYMEKNAIVGKVYLRDWEVVVNDSATDYNGLIIGVNSSAFEHFEDAETKTAVQGIGKGIKISRDDEGNIYLTKLSKNNVFIKGFTDPEKYCFSQEVGATEGKLEYDRVKIFDVEVFKQRVAKEIQKSNWDPYFLARSCVFSFAFMKDTPRDVETPSWVCVINFAALDLLGKSSVLDNIKKLAKLSDKEAKETKKRWETVSFNRRADGYGGSNPRDSARM